MQEELSTYALVAVAVLIAGISKGGFGNAAAFAATPIIALALPPAVAVGMMLPILMVMDAVGIASYWRKWSWPSIWPMMITVVPGVALGAVFFERVDPAGIKLVVGLVAVLFVAYQLAVASGWTPEPGGRKGRTRRALFWGAATGFTSFISHAGGPPAAMHLLSEKLDKTTYQATAVGIFWWVNLVKVPPYAAIGLFDERSMMLALVMAPVAVIGALIGVWAHKRLSPVWFFRLVMWGLAIVGARLVWDGARGVLGGG